MKYKLFDLENKCCAVINNKCLEVSEPNAYTIIRDTVFLLNYNDPEFDGSMSHFLLTQFTAAILIIKIKEDYDNDE